MIAFDPLIYLLAIPAVLLVGISKSGLSGGMGMIAVPLLAVSISPVQAAAIMLPILCAIDLFVIYNYRHQWDRWNLWTLVPGALIGIGIGALTFSYVDENSLRILLGTIALIFSLNGFRTAKATEGVAPKRWIGRLCGLTAGYTSFVAHAGGAPVKFFLLPQKMDKTLFVGTNAVFFLIVNYTKLVPYAWLGQLDFTNLTTSLILSPLVPLGVWLGLVLHKRISQELFYQVSYVLLFVAGAKLIWDGFSRSGWV
ncbi:sulfite exporter TauE/SafE family protein [Aestuariispira insulae]|uniref:Probable membrane transporter protein n=1 Tax=Aestuariispira insulae TaxID=1461337 RepID=A0A3D9H6F0_9PROT|nr:sulfite exporter TauE/SafE family protein [Aestuariispira insulae]RED45078.1 hypothetical protein DFP90_11271 [Aestuariispira insulae]